MLSENAQKLVDALRSGKYSQGKYALTVEREDGVQLDCCLGVACKIAIENGVEIKTAVEAGQGVCLETQMTTYEGQSSILPRQVQEWLGFGSEEASFAEGESSLIGMNDTGSSFDEIAAIIEYEPEGLFA